MRGIRLWLSVAILWLGTASLLAPVRAAERIEDLRNQARQLEKEGDWSGACAFYAYILSKDRSQVDVQERFQTCLRHFHRVNRHRDPSYREQVLGQDVSVALKVYGEVLTQLQAEYLEEDKADIGRLFRQGIEELRLALHDEAFRREYAPEAKGEALREFFTLVDELRETTLHHSLDAQNEALRVALAAKKTLGLKPTVTVLEIACGACNALDEHTYYLTPRRFGDDRAALKGEMVGVGIDLTQVDGKLFISQVIVNSPAAKAGLESGGRVTRIDRVPVQKMSLDAALEKLKGKSGSTVELEVQSAHDKIRAVKLARQPVNGSVLDYRIIDPRAGVGYLQLACFHENTLSELDEAVRQLEYHGMKSLIVDLRGNPGGLFSASVQAAERFLEEGAAIVRTRGRARGLKKTSHNLNPLAFPLVLLIDGNTASAAEVLAGALKENRTGAGQPRATLVGQTTLGKGTIQHMVELKTVQAGGIRITWARFYSPLDHRYQGAGVTPHIPVERSSMAFDDQLQAALEQARLLALPLNMMSDLVD